ncbi:MAG: lactate utilization protein [Alphaproteobacteria bacterium]|nr:lactate utilization protein [Alphaproteobacteria bacterium]
MTTRGEIFARIRAGIGRDDALDDEKARELIDRLESPKRNLVPARSDLDRTRLVDLFVSMAEEAAATVQRVSHAGAIPRAVVSYLARHNLPMRVTMAPDSSLDRIPWKLEPMLALRQGKADPADEVSLTAAFAGIAESGTLMVISGAHHPSTLNLLPDSHMVVLHENQIVGAYEDGWDLLRRAQGDGEKRLPRTVLFVTGPSRSADIEQTIQMGAHGPRRLHILLVADYVGQGRQAS